jgi:hypothetical protein
MDNELDKVIYDKCIELSKLMIKNKILGKWIPLNNEKYICVEVRCIKKDENFLFERLKLICLLLEEVNSKDEYDYLLKEKSSIESELNISRRETKNIAERRESIIHATRT